VNRSTERRSAVDVGGEVDAFDGGTDHFGRHPETVLDNVDEFAAAGESGGRRGPLGGVSISVWL
jgi:hypothetical protein